MVIPVITIDRCDAFPAFRATVLRELEMRGLYRDDHLYRGFNACLIPHVRLNGVEAPGSPYIYTNSEEFLSVVPDPEQINPLSYALSYGALAIYRGDRLRQYDSCSYEFIGPGTWRDALVAIFRLV